MLVLYTAVLLAFGVTHFLLRRRVASLERRYSRVAGETDAVLKQTTFKEGNSSRPDPCQAARRQFELGRLVAKRDALEARYAAWQGRAEKCAAGRARLRRWQGRFLPYACGMLDVALALLVLNRLADGAVVNATPVVEAVASLLAR
jgi:hypothetical protein